MISFRVLMQDASDWQGFRAVSPSMSVLRLSSALVTRTAGRILATIAVLAVLAAACSSGTSDDAGATPTERGDATNVWPHEFEATLIGGGTIDTGDYAGQDLVLWFWAPW
jgi:hypothetical protein